MTNIKSLAFLLLITSLLVSGCGFHLRGADSVGIPAERLFLDTSGSGNTGREVEQQLKLTDVELTKSASEADYILRVNNEDFRREVLSVSPRTGKVEEYELILSVAVSVATGDGQSLLDDERVSSSRDYVFDEEAVIATGDEQQLIRDELTRLIAGQALLRARAVIENHQEGAADSDSQ
ncbi:LPS-assembly lipoprotein [Methylohalomonas lacus]|uniref:LPS-assembly lipoprotein LptE n=1 Tax=Methylohalomonas lacus TaxID=398773 RepID=A0AAE3HMB6_9GAMM|nr:LPS assembly lipoprotein LptE [Methylohalomonas lacus]MCS3903963.1 LPS-assembly lipoprotein [Methylohalomonas lacus]